MSTQGPTPRTTVRRLPLRGRYDQETLAAILDEGLVCHVGFVSDGQPYVLPITYGRIGERLYLHGSAAARMMRTMGEGIPVCVTVTLLDGLVLARSAFHHSMNYRSAVILGRAEVVPDSREKVEALRAIVEHVVPGRWGDVRGPSALELQATTVLRLALNEASSKVRTGPPLDDEEDYGRACWAGEIPLRLVPGDPVADPRLAPGVSVPGNVSGYRRPPSPSGVGRG